MTTYVFLDLDETLWKKLSWGGIISKENIEGLRRLKRDAKLIVNTGRPQTQVTASFARSGNAPSDEWYDIPLNDTLPLSLFDALIFEDGLLVKVNDGAGFTTVFNSLGSVTPEYLRIREALFSERAKAYYRERGFELVPEGIVTYAPDGYAVRDHVSGEVIRKLPPRRTPIYHTGGEAAKITFKIPFRKEDPLTTKEHPFYKAVAGLLDEISPGWEQEVGIDLPSRAIDLFPLKIKESSSREIFRKAEANELLLKHWRSAADDVIVYVGDGPNDVRAVQELEKRHNGRIVFIAPAKSDPKVLAYIGEEHRENVFCTALPSSVDIDDIIAHVVRILEERGIVR